MRKGTGNKQCSACNVRGIYTPLTKENCSPSIFKRGYGDCRTCSANRLKTQRVEHPEISKRATKRYRDKYPERVKRTVSRSRRLISVRHSKLLTLFKTRREQIPQTDLIYSRHFYEELVRDGACHYCLGPLSPTGHGLDRINNSLSHSAFNVVPCCKSCNQKKSYDTTYDEMMLLAPALREIRKRREAACGKESALDVAQF